MEKRESWGMLYKHTGQTVYLCGGREYMSSRDSVILVPKGSSYEWRLIENGYFSYVNFEADMTCNEIFALPVFKPDTVRDSFIRLERLWIEKPPMYKMTAMMELYSLLNLLLLPTVQPYALHSNMEKLKPAMEYLSRHSTEPVTNEQLALLTGYSTSHFRRLFCEAYQLSPMAYLQQLRISRAKEMLRMGYNNITGVALSVGYANIYDFSRAFKKETGQSPTEFARTDSLSVPRGGSGKP